MHLIHWNSSHITCRGLSYSQKAFAIQQPASYACSLSVWRVCLWTGSSVHHLKCREKVNEWQTGRRERWSRLWRPVSMATAFTSLCLTERCSDNSGRMYSSVHRKVLNPRGSVWSEGALRLRLSSVCILFSSGCHSHGRFSSFI